KGVLLPAPSGAVPIDISNACKTWSETVTLEVTSPSVATYSNDVCTLIAAALKNTASFKGSISATTLTSDSIDSGALAVGQFLTGKDVPFGTMIVGGSGTTWTINTPLRLDSQPMNSAGYTTWRSGPEVTEIRIENYLTSSLY